MKKIRKISIIRNVKWLFIGLMIVCGVVNLNAATVNLVWDHHPDPTVTGYNIYRATPPQPYVKLNVTLIPQPPGTDSPTYTDTTPSNTQQFSYVVRAVNSGGIESGDSNIAVFNPPPTPPTNLRIMSFSAINLFVDKNKVATGPVPTLNFILPRATPPRDRLITVDLIP